jgi:hypothetical protein
MKIKIRGVYHVRHIRAGKVLSEFTTNNSLTRRGAFDLLERGAQFSGYNGGFALTGQIPETEGANLQDFISYFWWHSYFIDESGFVALSRNDRIRYWDQGTGNDLSPALNDNRQWVGDNYGIKKGRPRDFAGGGINTDENLAWTSFDGVPIVPGPMPRNKTSAESLMVHRIEGNTAPHNVKGAWFWQFRNTSDFGQDSVVSSVVFPEVIELHQNDILEVTYKLTFDHTVIT